MAFPSRFPSHLPFYGLQSGTATPWPHPLTPLCPSHCPTRTDLLQQAALTVAPPRGAPPQNKKMVQAQGWRDDLRRKRLRRTHGDKGSSLLLLPDCPDLSHYLGTFKSELMEKFWTVLKDKRTWCFSVCLHCGRIQRNRVWSGDE